MEVFFMKERLEFVHKGYKDKDLESEDLNNNGALMYHHGFNNDIVKVYFLVTF